MDFEWDETKNASNKVKHQVGFELAKRFLWDEAIIEPDNRRDYGEERFIARGLASDGLGYHVAFTMRGDRLRVITMRRFSRKDYMRYGK
jgi:hypothetical protein